MQIEKKARVKILVSDKIYFKRKSITKDKERHYTPLAATQIELEIIILSEESERERQILYDTTYMWNLIGINELIDINELIGKNELNKTETDSQT